MRASTQYCGWDTAQVYHILKWRRPLFQLKLKRADGHLLEEIWVHSKNGKKTKIKWNNLYLKEERDHD